MQHFHAAKFKQGESFAASSMAEMLQAMRVLSWMLVDEKRQFTHAQKSRIASTLHALVEVCNDDLLDEGAKIDKSDIPF